MRKKTDNYEQRTTVSFCLPVYNVEKYIEDCIISIVSQGIPEEDYEIICVDDKSTDGSYEKLIALASVYSQIKVVQNKQNRGVSYTRNQGIRLATKSYIWFVDPDDMLMPNVSNAILTQASLLDANILLCDYVRVPEQTNVNDLKEISNPLNPNTVFFVSKGTKYLPLDSQGTPMNAIWSGLWSREELVRSSIQFREGMISQEDTLFYYEAEQHITKAYKWPIVCYAYRQRALSVMHSKSKLRNKNYYISMRIMLDTY